ncbi:50S ribosome-binding GTPase [Streptomyces sp. NBC_01525]|uniref:GTPase n=1 Tax=Streptomyces sp. NBC_01525 TaxID=2903893 RepID=UPI003864E4F3
MNGASGPDTPDGTDPHPAPAPPDPCGACGRTGMCRACRTCGERVDATPPRGHTHDEPEPEPDVAVSPGADVVPPAPGPAPSARDADRPEDHRAWAAGTVVCTDGRLVTRAAAWDDGLIARRAPATPRDTARRPDGTPRRRRRLPTPWITRNSPRTPEGEGRRIGPQGDGETLAAAPAARGMDAAAPTGPAPRDEPAPGHVPYGWALPGGGFPRIPDAGRHDLGDSLRARLDALRQLIVLSRTRLDGATLDDAGQVLDAADERHRLSDRHTVVAIAGATGSGKSSLFNALAGAPRSRAGAQRPTTGEPVACVWTGGSPGADGLLHRLGVPPHRRHTPARDATGLDGLVLLDLPDHDSAQTGHREQVDRLLGLVDAVIWVVDPEKYADAVLHERYLRPLAGYAEVTFVVLNQIDRLPGDAADQVVDDLRRLLDDDGMALGEHGEPGATVLALSAATGTGVGELRDALARFVADHDAADRRLAADVDAAAARLRPVYTAQGRVTLTAQARRTFDERLAEAVGAAATGRTAEHDWLRHADRACATPWTRLHHRRTRPTGDAPRTTDDRAAARPVIEQAVRNLVGEASRGLPAPWAHAVRDAAGRGAEGLPAALDTVAAEAEEALRPGPDRPRWWTVTATLQGLMCILQIIGTVWLLGTLTGPADVTGWPGALAVTALGVLGAPTLTWACAAAARAPARRHGQETERRLRDTAAHYGRAHVLEPVAAELLRYQEVREQFAVASGG